jgi:hypothetical protein
MYYQHYNSMSVSLERFDQLDEQADEQEDAEFPSIVSIIAWTGVQSDAEVDAEIAYLLNRRDWDSEDPWRRDHDLNVPGLVISAKDLVLAADLLGLTLGTVFTSPATGGAFVELDWVACKAAAACAIVGLMPMWAMVCYRDTALTRLPEKTSHQASWGWPYAPAHEADGALIRGA